MEQAPLIEDPGIEEYATDTKIRLALPWPPSANHYLGKRVIFPKLDDMMAQVRKGGWKSFHKWLSSKSFVSVYLTQEAKDYHTHVWSIAQRVGARVGWEGPVVISAWLHQQDRRKRDNSNLWKMVEDALESAGVVKDDNQFVEHHDYRREVVKPGMVVVELEKLVK